MKRDMLTSKNLDDALDYLKAQIIRRLNQKGEGIFASRHEILGIITEEYSELIDAVHQRQITDIRDELLDIAVGCIFAIASIESGNMDW